MPASADARNEQVRHILSLRVPVIAVIGETRMKMAEVLALKPGTVIELGKPVTAPLDLLVNDRRIGCGRAVRVGDQFGMEIARIGPVEDTIRNLGKPSA